MIRTGDRTLKLAGLFNQFHPAMAAYILEDIDLIRLVAYHQKRDAEEIHRLDASRLRHKRAIGQPGPVIKENALALSIGQAVIDVQLTGKPTGFFDGFQTLSSASIFTSDAIRKNMTSFEARRNHLSLGGKFFSQVQPADFPETVIRYRNTAWADRLGLSGLDY